MNRLIKSSFHFLRWICPAYLVEEIEGDLIQRYDRDVIKLGTRKAKQKMLWNIIRFCRPGIILRNNLTMDLNQFSMFQNYFKTTFRHLLKNKVNFAFKLGGLTLALFSFLVIAIYVSYQLSFDRFHADYKSIYRLNSIRLEDGKPVNYATVPPALGPALKSEFPEIIAYAGIIEC